MKHFILNFIILFCCQSQVWSQTIGNWEPLYSDESNDLLVEIKITSIKDSCGDGSTYTHRFSYKIRQSTTNHPYYVSWKMDYLDCDGNPYCQERSIDIQPNQIDGKPIESTDFLFICSRILKPNYEATISDDLKQSNKILIIPNSIAPNTIEGEKNIYLGQTTTIKVKGGTLGTGADWFWYKDQCGGKSIGQGELIEVNPTDSTTYFVRAEGTNNTTLCAKTTIHVDKRSTSPNRIVAETKVCKGDNNELTVEGGSLGYGAEWIWHINDCDGQKIGEGKTIIISPTTTTTYYVRAEGDYNKTNCASILVDVFEKSLDPKLITPIGSAIICDGNKIKLKVTGGQLSVDAEWKWYSGTCGGSPLAKGTEVEFKPISSTTYFVRGEGHCNKTNCISLEIKVNDKSYGPGYISSPPKVFKNRKAEITVNGGSLGSNAHWNWFKDSCASTSQIGIGSTITIRTRRPTTYFVRAKGQCNETNCVQTTITPLKNRDWTKTYSNKHKFLHLGFGIGLEWLQLSEQGTNNRIGNGSSTTIDSTDFSMKGLGIKAEIPFYPFMKDYLSLGFISSFAYGTTPTAFKTDKSTTSNTKNNESISYHRFQFETELAFGSNPVKLLFKLKRSFQSNSYQGSHTSDSINYTKNNFNPNVNKEVLSTGLRLGRYERENKNKSKRGNNIDLLYTFSRNHTVNMVAFSLDDYKYLSNWNVGTGISWWRHSAFKFQFDVFLNAKQGEFNLKSADFKKATYLVTLIYNHNTFY